MTDIAYIALGSNLGDRSAALEKARAAIAALDGVRVTGASEIEETEPVGPVEQGRFLNQMVSVTTALGPHELLEALQDIERAAGRLRTVRWGPRTLDLDIVMIDGLELSDEVLTLPHPELPNRDFWLRELAQLRGHADGG
jgi:2-amino-4-hydroxy-6-hydroxymethyldihydropteridine diphosphokinase